jgi:hypothetical protein
MDKKFVNLIETPRVLSEYWANSRNDDERVILVKTLREI